MDTGNLGATAIESLISGSVIAMTYKVIFTKQRSLGQIFSMDSVREGGKLAVSSFIYQVAGRPIVRSAQNLVGGVVGSATK